MAEEQLERLYTVPLRRSVANVPRNRRANVAVKTLRNFVARHMKTEADLVWVDTPVNQVIWDRGRHSPPGKIRVKVIRFEDGVVEVSLPEE